MLTIDPFSELAVSISPGAMQTYVVAMMLLVIGGTIYDVIHKQSAKYFFKNMQRSKSNASQEVGGGQKLSIAIQTVAEDVLASGEFCNPKRRIAHLLTITGISCSRRRPRHEQPNKKKDDTDRQFHFGTHKTHRVRTDQSDWIQSFIVSYVNDLESSVCQTPDWACPLTLAQSTDPKLVLPRLTARLIAA